jgi:hypothetical protein
MITFHCRLTFRFEMCQKGSRWGAVEVRAAQQVAGADRPIEYRLRRLCCFCGWSCVDSSVEQELLKLGIAGLLCGYHYND